MKKRVVITYGTWDLFHYGHYLLLKRAKELGDYLVVGVSTSEFCKEKGKICVLSDELRMQIIADLSFVDEVIPEHNMQQKIYDIEKYSADVFVLGSDYVEKFRAMDEFDYVSQHCEVVFLERTPEISTSELKNKLYKQLGIKKIL